MMLALTAHVAQAYGGFRHKAETSRGALPPWQLARACDKLEADIGGKLPLQAIAAGLGLSVSHFSRAFRASTGLPPYRWLLHHRVRTAKRLMSVRGLSLFEVAISAGFANQSHFTRVFSEIAGISPGAWRRDALGTASREE
jgi:transcriptional regulator GlxA family with amidase domain